METVVIDYNAGNTLSVLNALKRLEVNAHLTADKEVISNASRVILPGVGDASYAMKELQSRNLAELIPTLQQPFLGICIGMQLLGTHSEEGGTECLGIVPLPVKQIPNDKADIKVPHIGWNSIYSEEDLLTEGLSQNAHLYFVHSYYMPIDKKFTVSECTHGIPFSSIIRKDNFYGVQFHPEKSSIFGEKILENFLSL